jgi:L-asparaginase / beta-aspartyl-peptidase
MNPVVIIHGGAWAIPDHLAGPSREGVKTAAASAYTILKNGGTAVDAVEAAVKSLENDPAFDAGKGSCLNAAGKIEMDASIMDGATWKAGNTIDKKDYHENTIKLPLP